MTVPILMNSSRIWLNDRDPTASEPTGISSIRMTDGWINTETQTLFRCINDTADALEWVIQLSDPIS